jgi:hypothetical protein
MGGVAALARKGKDLAAEMPSFAPVSYKLIYGWECVIYATSARAAVCVWIEKNGLVLVVISEKVKGIKWFCVCVCVCVRVCKSAGHRRCPRLAFSAGHLWSLPFRVASFRRRSRRFWFQKLSPSASRPTSLAPALRANFWAACAFVCVESWSLFYWNGVWTVILMARERVCSTLLIVMCHHRPDELIVLKSREQDKSEKAISLIFLHCENKAKGSGWQRKEIINVKRYKKLQIIWVMLLNNRTSANANRS